MLGQNYRIEIRVALHWQADYNADASESSTDGWRHEDSFWQDFNWSLRVATISVCKASAMNFQRTNRAKHSAVGGDQCRADIIFTAPHEQTFQDHRYSAQFGANNQPLDSTLAQLVPMGQPATARFFIAAEL